MGGAESCCAPGPRAKKSFPTDDQTCAFQSPLLVLNFDVNKTIVMSDVASQKSTDLVMGEVLSASTWGRMEEAGWVSSASWSWDKRTPSSQKSDPSSLSYADFLKRSGKPAQERRKAMQAFGKEGSESYCNTRTKMTATMTLPESLGKSYKALFSPGSFPAKQPWRFIVPSFFRLLQTLASERRKFVVVFRTFGKDLDQGIIDELNAFADGQHPFYPGAGPFDGSAGLPDLRFSFNDKASHGSFFRDANGDYLILGTLERPPPDNGISSVGMKHYEDKEKDGIEIFRGHAAIKDYLSTAYTQHSVLAFRDYYPYWGIANKESSDSGKLIYIDSNDPSVHPIFFDDNIDIDAPHIIDARDPIGQTLPFETVSGVHLVRCEPLDCVLDPEYFVNRVRDAEILRQERSENK